MDDPPFWAEVDQSGECWVWTGSIGRSGMGYGLTSRYLDGRRVIRAHRWSWILANGPIPEGMAVLHHCDNPPCVRPEHLFLGTDADNARDRDAKRRRVNIGRKWDSCKRGHPLTDDNRAVNGRRWATCLICSREASKLRARAKRALHRACT